MTNYERMIKGVPYDPADKEIVEEQAVYQKELVNFNRLDSTDEKAKQEYMKRVFGDCGDNCYIELPFYANWGGHHLHLGKNVYANFGLTCVDDGHIYVGDYTLFGPHVTLATANHCIEPGLRKKGYQYNKDIHIGNNVWIAANVSILPGVTIGDNSVIGAGSVVNKDIPANVIAVGCPCRVIREINERDREYFYKDEKIDWENL